MLPCKVAAELGVRVNNALLSAAEQGADDWDENKKQVKFGATNCKSCSWSVAQILNELRVSHF